MPVSVWSGVAAFGIMAKTNLLPPVYRDCQRLLLHTEQSVMRFSRYHKYTVGTDLRKQAFTLMRTVHRAVYDRTQQSQHIHTLLWQVDDFKLTLQLASDIGAFVQTSSKAAKPQGAGFSAFETAARLVVAIGKQCGGWLWRKVASVRAGAGNSSNAWNVNFNNGNINNNNNAVRL